MWGQWNQLQNPKPGAALNPASAENDTEVKQRGLSELLSCDPTLSAQEDIDP